MKKDKLWCKYYKPCGKIGWKSCKFNDMYDCSYEGDFNQCNMRNSILKMEQKTKEKEIRKMLSDIINNRADYEYKRKDEGFIKWLPYKLGEEISDEYEYRKVIKYAVAKFENKHYVSLKSNLSEETKIYFESTSEKECNEWIAEHSNWMEKNYGEPDWVTDDIDANEIRVSAIEDFVKEFLSRVYNEAKEYNDSDDTPFTPDYIDAEDLEKIIKEMGVELC